MDFLRLVGRRIQTGDPGETQITSLRDVSSFGKPSKKTRPPAEYDARAALPCPDIEIGSRQPGN
jgi:hypothetical protein